MSGVYHFVNDQFIVKKTVHCVTVTVSNAQIYLKALCSPVSNRMNEQRRKHTFSVYIQVRRIVSNRCLLIANVCCISISFIYFKCFMGWKGKGGKEDVRVDEACPFTTYA